MRPLNCSYTVARTPAISGLSWQPGTDCAASNSNAQASTSAEASWLERLIRCSSPQWVTCKVLLRPVAHDTANAEIAPNAWIDFRFCLDLRGEC